MKNLCYNIDSNINEFPFLLYQYGLFEKLHVDGVGIDRTIRIIRKPTSPQVVTQYSYQLNRFGDRTGYSLTNEQFIVLLLTVCEIHVAYKHEVRRNVELFQKASKAEHEFNILSDIATKTRINKRTEGNINLIPSDRLFYSVINFENIFPNDKQKVVLGSLISRISSDENLLNTGMWFNMESTQFSRHNSIKTKLYSFELPKSISATAKKELSSLTQEEARAILNLLLALHQNFITVQGFNAALEKQHAEYEKILPIESKNVIEYVLSIGSVQKELNNSVRDAVQAGNKALIESNLLYQSEISSKKQEIQRLEAKITSLEFDLNQRNKQEEINKERFAKLEKQHNEQLERLRNECSDKIARDSSFYKERIESIIENHNNEVADLNSQIDKLKKEHFEHVEKIKTVQNGDIEKIKEEYEKKIEKVTKHFEIQIEGSHSEKNNSLKEYERRISNLELKYSKEMEEKAAQFQLKIEVLENILKSSSEKHLYEIKNISNSFQRTIEILTSQNFIKDSEIQNLQEQVKTIRQEITNVVINERILDSSNYSMSASQWERTFFDELAIRLHQLAESESKHDNQQMLLDIQRWANDTKLNLELQKSEQAKLLAEIASSNLSMQSQLNEDSRLRAQFELDIERSNLEFEKRQIAIENRFNSEDLEREKQKLLLDRANLQFDQKQFDIANLINEEEINRKRQDLKIEEIQNNTDKKLLDEKIERIRQEISNEKTIINIEQRDLHIQSQLKDDAIERAKHELKVEKLAHSTEQKIDRDSLEREKHLTKIDSISLDFQRQRIENMIDEENIKRKESELSLERSSIDIDKKRMMVDFISLQNELKSETLSIKEFALQKTLDYQRFELQQKENILKMSEMITLQESNNLKGERNKLDVEISKLEVANKLAELGLQVREQEVRLQNHLNEIEKNKISNEKQLLEINKGKVEIQELLSKNTIEFQRNQNELDRLLLKIQEGEFKTQANLVKLEMEKRHFENEFQFQSLGLTKREDEIELKKRENDIRSILLTNQGVVNHLLALQKENKLFSQMEEERQSYYKQEQTLQDRIWSLQNSLANSQNELSNRKAWDKYFK